MSAITSHKLRSPLKWHGGKSYLARRITALFPPHRVYVEPFIGGGSVLLNKAPAEREVAGDLNAALVNFWFHVAQRGAALAEILADVPYAADRFEAAKALPGQDGLYGAVAFLVRNRMSRGGLGESFAWSERLRGKTRPGGPVPGDLNAWDTIREELPRIAGRVKGVGFNCCDAVQLIESNDAPDALVYCDPPYLHETRTAKKAYAHEMTRADHERLLACLLGCRGRVFLSGYRSELYDSALAGWTRHEFDMPNHSGQGGTKQRRIECLWKNPEP